MKNQRKIFFIGAILLVLFVVLPILIFIFTKGPSQKTEKESERGGPPLITIVDESGRFSSSFTFNDSQTIREKLTSYIATEGGDPWDKVTLSNIVTPFREGDETTFTVLIPSLNNKSVDVVVKLPTDGTTPSTLRIPKEDFLIPLYPQNES